MSSRSVDAIVLGAGMVGVSAALALQARGRSVAIVDRQGEAADETSFGNAGIIQSEAVVPYLFPRAPGAIARAALNQDPRAHIRYGAMPASARPLWRYFLASTEANKAATAKVMAPLVFGAAEEHLKLAAAAGASELLRPGGWIKVWRSARGEEASHKEVEELRPYGVVAHFLDRAALVALEPNVGEAALGGAHFPDPLSTPDPQGLARAYAAHFVKLGGRLEKGDAKTLEPSAQGWTVATEAGRLAARDVVIALGPWSNDLVRARGLSLPFFVKRGYHMHYEPRGNQGLIRPVLDLEKGYLVTPMKLGPASHNGRRVREARGCALARASSAARAVRARNVPDRAAQGRRPLARPPPLLAGYAPDHRAVPGEAGPLARLRPPALRPDARPNYRAAARRNDDRRDALRRPCAVPGGAVWIGRTAVSGGRKPAI